MTFMNRDEDKEWRGRINERLASLTAGETVQDGRIEDLEEEYAHIGEIETQVLELDRKVNELRAVMLPDSLGHGGVIRRLMNLEDKKEDQSRTMEARLKFWGPIVIAIISSSALIVREWPDIAARWHANMEQLNAPDDRQPKKARHKIRRTVVPDDADTEENSQ